MDYCSFKTKNALLYFNYNFAKEKLLLDLEDILKK